MYHVNFYAGIYGILRLPYIQLYLLIQLNFDEQLLHLQLNFIVYNNTIQETENFIKVGAQTAVHRSLHHCFNMTLTQTLLKVKGLRPLMSGRTMGQVYCTRRHNSL